MSGRKDDSGKVDYSQLSRAMIEPMIRALMFGANKYKKFNHKGGFENTRLLAASLRHIMAFMDGEDLDPESGESHLAHGMAALAILLDNQSNGTSIEGRYQKPV